MRTFLGLNVLNQCPDCGIAVTETERHELKLRRPHWMRLCEKCIAKYKMPVSTTTGHIDSARYGNVH